MPEPTRPRAVKAVKAVKVEKTVVEFPKPPPSALQPAKPFGFRVPNPFTVIDPLLRRDEADILFVAGNVALVALEIVDWPVAAIAITLHLMHRSRLKVLDSVAEVLEEAE
jgi:hypothetical protein